MTTICADWPLPPTGCPLPTGSPVVTGMAVQAATEILFDLSGRQFGQCTVTFRPCRRNCHDGAPWGGWWDGHPYPGGTPWPGSALAWAAECGSCRGGCSCNAADTLLLPELVQSVVEVTVDGVVLSPAAYNLFDGWRLVRADGERWPMCQDWTVPVSGVGAWTVTAVVGLPVPMAASLALGQLASVYADWCSSGVCKMPAYTTQKSRQGVTQSFPTAAELRQLGMTGLGLVDMWLGAVNPTGLRQGPAIWNPDDYDAAARQPGGV